LNMNLSSSALVELLAGKTPEAMYDALHAGRYLSQAGQDAPANVLDLIKTFVRSARQRPLLPATMLKRLAASLVESGYLNEAGEQLASE
jgi:hypothetical protein